MSDQNNKQGFCDRVTPKFQRCSIEKTWQIKKNTRFIMKSLCYDETIYFSDIQIWFLPDIFDKRLKENMNPNCFIHHMTNIPDVKYFMLHWFGWVSPKASVSWVHTPSYMLICLIMKISCLPTLFSSNIASSGKPSGAAWFKAILPHLSSPLAPSLPYQ